MKFLSIKYLISKAKISLYRFPLVILSAILGVTISIYLVETKSEFTEKLPYINALLTFALGVPLFFCVKIYLEKNRVKSLSLKTGIHIAGILFLGYIYSSLPSINDTHNTFIPYIRYGVFNLIIHLLVSFTPYLKTKELNGFWNYNKTLFLRLCASVLYSGFIYVGLILALLAIDNLFKIDIDENLYFELYIITIGLFNTWFFISGIPKNIDELNDVKNYPKSLKIFTQYVLLPLLTLYLVILYFYGGKIILNWDWPKGWVSYLVSSVSILGFFNILLMYPYGKLAGNEWIKKFTKLFYLIIIPLVVLLFVAIFMRVTDYGITIKRYNVILLGVWICLVSLFFLLKKGNIKFIPISLAILLFISSFGIWGMFSVSEKSQVNRLKNLLIKSNILVDGKIQNEVIWIKDSLPSFDSELKLTNNKILSDSLHNEVKSILDYLNDYHGLKTIRSWFSQNLDSMISVEKKRYKHLYTNEARTYMETMGMEYRKRYTRDYDYQNYHFGTTSSSLIHVKGYNYYYSFSFNNYNKYNSKHLHSKNNQIHLYRQSNQIKLVSHKDSLNIDLSEIHKKLLKQYGRVTTDEIHPDSLTFEINLKDLETKIELQKINFNYYQDSLSIEKIQGNLLFNEK